MIQYIRIETDDDGAIVRLGFVDSMTSAYSAVKKVLSETSGLPVDASAKDHISKIKEAEAIDCTNARLGGLNSGQKYTKDILAKHSGLDPINAIGDHIAAIKLKAYDEGYNKGWHDKKADLQKRMKQFEEAIKSK